MSRSLDHPPLLRHRGRHLSGWLTGSLIALACGPGHAQQSPYYLSLSQQLSYDSNLFRVPDGASEQSDVISTTSVTVGVDQPIGRHRVFGSASASRTLYRDNNDLDSSGYDVSLGANVEATSRLSGNARIGASRRQASFSNYGALTGTASGRNLEDARTADLRIQYGGASILVLEGLANYNEVEYSATGFGTRDHRLHMFGGGLRYQPGGPWTLGLTVRRTNGEYPSFAANLADEYDRTDVDLVATYTPTGASRITARLTKTKEDHDLDTSRDFNGVTGEVRWDYQVTGKVTLGVNVVRDTGSGSSGYTAVPPSGSVPPGSEPTLSYLTDSRLSNRFGLDARWAATAKVVAGARLDYSRDRYDSSFVGGSGDSRGSTRSFRLTVDYTPTRVWLVQCGLGYEQRTSDVVVGGLDYEYSANTGFCSVTLRLQ